MWYLYPVSGHQDIRTSGHQDIRTSGHQDIRTSGHQDIRTSGHQDIRTSGHQDIRTSGHITIKVDMAAEHDEGRFLPEIGDKVTLVGNFNNWESGEIEFVDENGDWIYEATFNRSSLSVADTISFKFVITSEQNRDLPNSGWEVIPNRIHEISTLTIDQPVYRFNESWSPLVTRDLTFRVNMSNQQVLGFFNPETDKVIVLGSFNNWKEDGVELNPDEHGLIYHITFPVESNEDDVITYRYKIEPGKQRMLPDEGQEFIAPRMYKESKDSNLRNTEFFNDQLRVLRIVATKEWVNNFSNLEADDRLYFQLNWNGSQSQIYRLEPNSNSFEAALQIPETVSKVKGVILLNYDQELYQFDSIQVMLNGKTIKL